MAGGGTTKRMSADEKRATILDIYHKTKSVYTEKEILTLAAKAGVNANTVADMNNALVDDGLVDKAKIGGANYFWSFPAKQSFQQQLQHEATLQQIATLQTSLQHLQDELATAQRGREEDDQGSRATMLARLSAMATDTAALQAELASLQDNDPQVLADLEKELRLCTEAAHRWTDNIFNIQAYLVKKRGMDKKNVDKMLGIPAAGLDYPEDKLSK